MSQNWDYRPSVPDRTIRELGLPPLQSQLLFNRGMSHRDDALSFISPSRSDLHDPMLLPDMDVAISRLRRAISGDELIGVFGDFDIDGISGTAVVAKGLMALGARVLTYIPSREDEGHGLNPAAVRSLSEQGVSLIVTVDCGASSESETTLASNMGIDTIITDHHTVFEDGPYPVTAMINVKRPDSTYPYEHLTGVGMAFKLMQALYAELGHDDPIDLLELVALGTIGDVGPLVGENRYFVSEGLRQMNDSGSPGILALAAVSGLQGKRLDTGALSFQIIPRLNASGRLGDAAISLELLMTTDSDLAESAAAQLDQHNSRRKDLTKEGVEQAEAQIRRRWDGDPPSIIMVGRRDWIPGVLGLIAARLAETYHRPAIAVSVRDDVSRASARSVAGLDVLGPIDRCSDLLVRFGGHEQAAGFTIFTQNLGDLAKRFESVPRGRPSASRIDVDLSASPSTVRQELYDFGLSLAPYGTDNPEPTYASGPVRVVRSYAVGSERKHLKLSVDDGSAVWDAIGFGLGDRLGDAGAGSQVELAYRMEMNTWKGRSNLQLVVRDLATA